MSNWPKGPTSWLGDSGELLVSVPFTWNLKPLREYLRQRHLFFDRATVGGPAIKLSRSKHFKMPFEWPDHVTVDTGDMAGVLERANPLAMRTSTGCPNRCGYCAVPTIEPVFSELSIDDVKPIICDNNFLGCSKDHRKRIYEQLLVMPKGGVQIDFNQGLDARLMTDWDAIWLRKIRATCRLAYDYDSQGDAVKGAIDRLVSAGCSASRIRIYALIGWKGSVDEAVARCRRIESWGAICRPMWFSELDAMKRNIITDAQRTLGWNEENKKAVQDWFWWHKGNLEASV